MNEGKRVVVRRSPAEWRAFVSRFERSGLGCRAFCVAEDLVSMSIENCRVLTIENCRLPEKNLGDC